MTLILFKIFMISFLFVNYSLANKCYLEDNKLFNQEQVFIRPYYIYNNVSYLLQSFPHVAIEIQRCTDSFCYETTVGKANNGKIYSPDIFTVGRICKNNSSKCKNINPGYNKKYISDWIPLYDDQVDKMYYWINQEKIEKSTYFLLVNNCATFVTKIINKIGIKFSCNLFGIDIPYLCSF